ncbi:transglutaminase domain-containing protein [uncultured Methanobrevibacter sp.]|uniref:transglutaminase domain-containing protein n=1 Tax=uncultured Methanobrevibacter sp. TaxID=253161 RepID=UPI00260971C9
MSSSAVYAEDLSDNGILSAEGNGENIDEIMAIDESIDNVSDINLDLTSGSDSNLSDSSLSDSSLSQSNENLSSNFSSEDLKKLSKIEILTGDNWEITGDADFYIVKLLDEDNNPIKGASIGFNIYSSSFNQSYIENTSENGIAFLPVTLNDVGPYRMTVSFNGDSDYNASSNSSIFYVYKKTSIVFPKSYGFRNSTFKIKLLSSNGTALAKKNLTVVVGKTTYLRTTDSNGIVSVPLGDVSSVSIMVKFDASGYYYASKLNKTINVYKHTFTKYLVRYLLRGNNFKLLLKGKDSKILSNTKIKFTVGGKNYFRTTNSKGIAYLKLNISRGVYKIEYSVYANGLYGPSSNSSTLEIIDPAGQHKRGLNVKTSSGVNKYLSGGGKAKVTASIRALAKSITKKYSTKFEKAVAIFNYVRDNLNYQYYANSLKGASKTLKTKAGNCCDHSNLIIALCRASKIPARYSHARGCKFGSGLVTGHVWAQIYVGGKWYSADGTSYRNSLGHVENWNTKSYHSLKNYRSIPF